jgi:aspartyl-tRNA(Asn)/glutamyl-tRNA(Gln) amidotransferase subunit A
MDPTTTTLTDLRDAIADKQVSATETVRAYLDRIEAINTSLNAYHETFAERALARAAEVDAGRITGPLAGVPIAVKDNLCTEWGLTTCSSRMLERYASPFTATAVRRLENAGAIVIGKTNLDEFAMGSSCENCAFGPVRNPWATDFVTGGSSGGSAAAVAADLCAAAIGSDTGGSIRQPASFCGIVGLKPTYGRVSRWGLVAFASSLDQVGPMTRTVADAALLLQVIAGHDPLDSTCADADVPDYTASVNETIQGARIGIAKEYMSDANDPAIAKAVEQSIDALRSQGAQFVEVSLPHTEYGVPTYYIVATAEASSNLARYDGIHYGHRSAEADDLIDLYARSRSEGFGDEVKRRIMLGTYALSSGYYDAYYLRALKVRRLIKGDFDAAFQKCDAILCPATPSPAFRIGQMVDDPLAMYLADIYTVNCNLAGLPGVTVAGRRATVGPGVPGRKAAAHRPHAGGRGRV